MKLLVVANWKCNPTNLQEAKKLFNSVERRVKEIQKVEVVICPPFVYLSNIQHLKSNIQLGAQDCFWEEKGAFTGEISPAMLKDLGVDYVIIGHSERRKYLKETDEMVNKKLRAVLKAGLKAILCVGSIQRGKNGEREMSRQLEKALFGVKKSDLENIVFTYEPIWAISTTRGSAVATPENTKEGAIFIRKTLFKLFNNSPQIKIIYGGSVDGSNIRGFIERAEMDGVLIGAASLKAEDFIAAVKNIDKLRKT
ncbi:MAG: triose-phosphate isomerase [Candidatus Nealsonbacteria bacterium CG02_land_8_20_14_3_00_37_10]|uniref:Triosephosphate isomerase n=2 Tax=Candidatus Nealsoniibacteriota TaxID=1817911 RepID=A0A2G9YYT9_9BACT|nr:MAG: triose-phosphate isomerase [Candidatus Nealsonbacteria bacterium CG23_combo_of_CG06-09_8_20_14_all_37_18]PIV45210.1 MAG: triose-phosphate isomerase [Candidatus Nealsonbacteria bacterium CG02_land_8_20_14_3_00_37_10]